MSFIRFDKNRQLIPRWHTYPMAQWLGLLDHSGPGATSDPVALVKRTRDWKNFRQLNYAIDLVGTATLLNEYQNPEAIEAAEFVLSRKNLSGLAHSLAKSFIDFSRNSSHILPEIPLPENAKPYWNIISNIKSQLSLYPRNYIKWAELAYFYSTIGQNDKAKIAMLTALAGNKNNRFLLLSASRFFLHISDPDRALSLLRKAIAQTPDPWIVSAEIAIADSLKMVPKEFKRGRKILLYDNISNYHRSELAGSIGTMELKSGQRKSARVYFTEALLAPTENTLAQVVHLIPQLGAMNFKEKIINNNQSFEAEAHLLYNDAKYESALKATMSWLRYQPFSSRPAVYGSFIASVALDNHEEAIKIAKIGLLSSPDEFILKNNYGFSLAKLDRLVEAREVLQKINESDLNKPYLATLLATKGTLAFRENRIEEARQLYKRAVEKFEELKDSRSRALAIYFWMVEENRNESKQEAQFLQAQLDEIIKKTGHKELEHKIKKDSLK